MWRRSSERCASDLSPHYQLVTYNCRDFSTSVNSMGLKSMIRMHKSINSDDPAPCYCRKRIGKDNTHLLSLYRYVHGLTLGLKKNESSSRWFAAALCFFSLFIIPFSYRYHKKHLLEL